MFNSLKKGKVGRVGSVNGMGPYEAKVVAEAKKKVDRVLKDIVEVAKKLGEEEAKVKVSIVTGGGGRKPEGMVMTKRSRNRGTITARSIT